MSPDDPRHGTYAGSLCHYGAGETPCEPCKAAAAAYRRDRRTRLYFRKSDGLLVPARGTHRRVQALQALGWSMEAIALQAGYASRQWVHMLMQHERLQEGTVEKVDKAYRAMSMRLPPETPATVRTRQRAKEQGWVPPLGWDDIDRDEAPAPMGSTRTSWTTECLIEEYEHLLSFGVSKDAAMRQLKVGRDRIEQAYKTRPREVA